MEKGKIEFGDSAYRAAKNEADAKFQPFKDFAETQGWKFVDTPGMPIARRPLTEREERIAELEWLTELGNDIKIGDIDEALSRIELAKERIRREIEGL